MRKTRSFFVNGEYYEIPEDEVEQFLATIQPGDNLEDAYNYTVDGEGYQIPASENEEFLKTIRQDERVLKPSVYEMDDGGKMAIDDEALRQLVQARQTGMPMSRGIFKQTGIPEQYGRSKEEREAFADRLAAQFADKSMDLPSGKGAERDNVGDDILDFANSIANSDAVRTIGDVAYDTIGKPLDYMKTATEQHYGRDVSGIEAIGANLPIVGSVMDANENRKEEVLKRLYNGDYRDSLERNKLALSIGIDIPKSGGDIELPGEEPMDIPLDDNGQDNVIRQMAGEQLANRLITRQKKGEKLNGLELNTLQEIMTEGIGMAKSVPEIINPVVGSATLGMSMMNRAADLHRGKWEVDENGNPVKISDGDDSGVSMAKGLAGATGERVVWGSRLPGSTKLAQKMGSGFFGRNTAQLIDMAAKGDITDFLDNVIGLGIPEDEVKKTVAEWSEEHLLPQNIAKDIIKAAPAHFMMKGARMLTPSGREQYRAEKEAKAKIKEEENRVKEEQKEIAREVAKGRYEANLSEEAIDDINTSIGEMVKNEVIPSWTHAEEVKQRAIEKLGGREAGENHEAVQQAVMEAAQEVQMRLQNPERVTSPAHERRLTEAKSRENERQTRAAEKYAADEKASVAAETERKGAEINADLDAQKAAYEKREKDIKAAFERGDGDAVKELLEEQKAEMDAYLKAEAERKAREAEEEATLQPQEVDIRVNEPPSAKEESQNLRESPEYAEWLRKSGRNDTDKNWNKYVMENELDPALRVERNKDVDKQKVADNAERNYNIEQDVAGAIDEIGRRINERDAAETQAKVDEQARAAKQADIEAAFSDWTEAETKAEEAVAAQKSGKAVKGIEAIRKAAESAKKGAEERLAKMETADLEDQIGALEAIENPSKAITKQLEAMRGELARRGGGEKPVEVTEKPIEVAEMQVEAKDKQIENPVAAKTEDADAAFRTWALDRDGKPIVFDTKEQEAEARKIFAQLVKDGKVDAKTGKMILGKEETGEIDAGNEQVVAPTTEKPSSVDGKSKKTNKLNIKAPKSKMKPQEVADTKLLGTDAFLPEKDLKAKVAQWKKNLPLFKGESQAKLQAQIDAAERILAAKKGDGKADDGKVGDVEPNSAEPGSIADTIEQIDAIIAAEESGGAAEGADAPSHSIDRSNRWQHGQGISKIREFFGGLKSRNSIIHKAQKLFPEFAFRAENTSKIGRNYNGYWKSWQELIRAKDTASLDTIPHEIGHGIDSLTRKGGLVVPTQDAKRELVKLGRALYGNLKPNGGYMGEGFAEYIRGRISGADNLDTECPNLHKWFNEEFVKNEKGREMMRRVDQLANEVTAYRTQTNIQKFAAFMRPSIGKIEKATNAVKSVFTQEMWNDEGATLTKAYKKSNLSELHHWQPKFKELEAEIKKNGNTQRAKNLAKEISDMVENDPRLFASNARGTSHARTLDMFKHGVTDINGINKIGNVIGFDNNGNAIRDNVTESARDIFRDFSHKEIKDWDMYAAAKIGLENYVKEGREFGYSEKDLRDIVSRFESPKFENALQRFSDFNRRALSVGLDCGALTPEQYKAIVDAHKYYMRTERRFDENASGVGGGQQNPIKGIKGSQRNIMNPRIATAMQTERQLRYFQTMKVLQLIGKDIMKAEGLNSLREKGLPSGVDYHIAANLPVVVPNAQEAVKFTSEKLKKDFVKRAAWHLEDVGTAPQGQFTSRNGRMMSVAESMALDLYEGMYGANGDVLTVFREKPSNGKNGVVSTYIDGKLVTFEIPDVAWEKYITGIEKEDWSPKSLFTKILWKATTLPAKTLRAGATTYNPAFIVPNLERDTFHAAVMSDDWSTVPVFSTLSGIREMTKGNNGMNSLWNSMGGEMSMRTGRSAEGMWKKGMEEAFAKNKGEEILNGFDPRNPLSYLNPIGGAVKAWADLLNAPELAPRIREMKGVYDRAKASGMTDNAAAILAFANGKDISIDFGKHGKAMKYINQVVPYTNAWYRGLEQFARNFGLVDTLPHQFHEGKGKALPTTAKGLLWMTVGAMANAFANMMTMNEDERRAEFKKIPREKWDYNDVLGIRVASPFELGSVFMSIPKAAIYEYFGDKGALKEAILYTIESNLGKYKSVADIAAGIAVAAPWIDIAFNKKWDGSPIVSPQIKGNHGIKNWADYSTTEIARYIGEKMDLAPAYIDHVMNGYTGGMWKRLLSPASDGLLSFATGVSTLKPRPQARRDVSEFYEFADNAGRSYNDGNISLENLGKYKRAEELKDKLSPMFDEMRSLNKSINDRTEKNKKRLEIMENVFNEIKKFEEDNAKDVELGIEKAVVSLSTSKDSELTDSVLKKNRAALKGLDFSEMTKAIRRYGRRNHWTEGTINKRIRRLRNRIKGE